MNYVDSVLWYGVYGVNMDEINKNDMTIGVLAKKSGVSVETIRFYQRKGILDKPQSISSFRKYSQSYVKRIKFIKSAKALGFSLRSIKDLLDISVCSSKTRPYISNTCKTKILEVEEKINGLEKMKGMLTDFLKCCGNEKFKSNECDLLVCFEKNWECCK